jgi:uncharacterized protein (TIGR04255 family)
MGTKMNDAPVYLTVVQVQYNKLTSLDAYLKDVGEAMRQAGFVDYKMNFVQQVHIEIPIPGCESSPSQQTPRQQLTRHIFSDMEGVSGFVLLPNMLAYYTTAYETFDLFLDTFLQGLQAVHKAVGGLSFTEKLSLRYLDAVMPKSDDTIDSYLVPELQGLPVHMPQSTFLYSMAQALRIQPGIGHFLCRSMMLNGSVSIPSELILEGLTLNRKFAEFSGPHAVIDTDGSYAERESFDLEKIAIHLRGLHDGVNEVFHASVTDHARQVWREGNL